MDGALLSLLEGRWIVEKDGASDGLVIIKPGGTVSFVGESTDSDLKIVQDSSSDRSHMKFSLKDQDGEELCSVKLETQEDGDQVLHLYGEDGYEETWRSTAACDGTPKIVPRRKTAAARRWTKEDQEGSSSAPPKKKATSETLALPELSEEADQEDAEDLMVHVKTAKENVNRSVGFPEQSEEGAPQGCSKATGPTEKGDEVLTVFNKWDRHGSGVISEGQLCGALVKVGIAPDVARAMLQDADASRDGVVNYKEFISWLFHVASA